MPQRRFVIHGGHLHELVYDTSGFLGTALGIREEHEVRVASDLLFAHPRQRDPFYQVGDFILRTELSYQDAAARFREFRRSEGDGFPWGDMLREVLDINTVTVTKRIQAIHGNGTRGTVTLKNFFKVSNNDLIDLHDHSGQDVERLSIEDLNVAAQWYERRYGGGQGALYYLEATAIVATLPFGGAARQASSRITTMLARRAAAATARYLLRRGCRRLVRFLLARATRSVAAFLLKFTRDFVTSYVRACRLSDLQNEIRVSAGRHPAPMERDRLLREACAGAVAENLIGEVLGGLGEALDEVDLGAAIGEQVKQAIGNHLSRRLLAVAAVPFQEIIRSSIAYTHDPSSGKSFSEGLTAHMMNAIQERFTERMVADEFRSAVAAIGENPGLVAEN